MEHSVSWLLGFGVGILIAAVVLVLFARKAHTDGCSRPRYDERQELARGRGYKYAFFTILVYEALYGVLRSAFGWSLLDDLTGSFVGIFAGIAVYACYAIWHDAYFALNEKRRYYIWLFAVITAINLAVGAGHIVRGELIVDGVIHYANSLNLLCAALFLVVLGTLLAKDIASRREDEA